MRLLLAYVASGVTVCALSAGLTVGTSGSAAAATTCRTSFSSYAAVGSGSTGSAARAVQCLLRRAGHRVAVDSSFSSADANQLKAFQTRVRLPPTGRASGATWAALIARGSRPALRTGSRGAEVVRLQLALRALGHRQLPGTSYYGPLTDKAVRSLQRSLGWKQTGVATADLWAALQRGGRRSSGGTPTVRPTPISTSPARGATALAFAKKQLGEPYRYGAAGPDRWDCSGLTMMAWRKAGVSLPHQAKAQYSRGKKVAKADLRPGDLVFFYPGISHVGIYAGKGRVIHASRPGKPVASVPMKYMPYHGARRPR